MSFKSARAAVVREELDFLSGKETICDHISLSADRYGDIINALSGLDRIHLDPFLKEGIIVLENSSFDEGEFWKKLKENCREMELDPSVLDVLMDGVSLSDGSAVEKILHNYSSSLFQKDPYGDIEDLADIAVSLLQDAGSEKHVLWFHAENTDPENPSEKEEDIRSYRVQLKGYGMRQDPYAVVDSSNVDYMMRSTESFICSISLQVPSIIPPQYRFNGKYRDLTSAVLLRMGKEKKAEEHMKNLSPDDVQVMMHFVSIFVHVTSYINHLQLHPELKEISPRRKKTSGAASSDPVAKHERSCSVHNIDINGIRFVTSDASLSGKLRSRKSQRLTDCWDVHGHYRHYKNGKVVYIAPYEKGPGRRSGQTDRKKKNYHL